MRDRSLTYAAAGDRVLHSAYIYIITPYNRTYDPLARAAVSRCASITSTQLGHPWPQFIGGRPPFDVESDLGRLPRCDPGLALYLHSRMILFRHG
jgi:hypothetical protein